MKRKIQHSSNKASLASRANPGATTGFWRRDWFPAALLIAATVIAHWPAMHGGFLFDDGAHISENPTLRSLEGLRETWFVPGATMQYYPLSFSVFWADYHLWRLDTFGYHLQNALLHGLASVLLWQILKRLRVPGALLAGAIFALHPVTVMSVAWMTELKNTLSGALVLGAAWAYLRFAGLGVYNRGDKSGTNTAIADWRFYVLSLALFLLALLAKTAVSFLPATLLLIAWWQRSRLQWRDIWPLIPMLGMAAMMGQMTSYVEHHSGGATGAEYNLGLPERILISGRSFWFYLGKLFFPYRLTFFYPRWHIDAGAWWQYLYPLATIGLFGVLWGMRRRIGKGPFAAMLHFYLGTSFLTLLLVLWLTHYSLVCDHWQYFGCPSVIALAAAGVTMAFEVFGKGNPLLKPVFCGALLLTLGVLTWQQSKIYTDAETLWRSTIDRNPACWVAYLNLGDLLVQNGKVDEAIADFEQALQIKPDYAEAGYDLGNALLQKGKVDEAIVRFQQTLLIKPDYAKAHNNLGTALFQQGKVDEAIAQYEQALEIDPGYLKSHVNLGNALLQKGRVAEAIVHYQKGLKLARASGQQDIVEQLNAKLKQLQDGATVP